MPMRTTPGVQVAVSPVGLCGMKDKRAGSAVPWRQSKRPHNRLGGAYGAPVHPALVKIPIGTWSASLLFDVASRVGGPPAALATGSLWLIGIGIGGAVGAAGAGYLDLIQVPAGTRAMRVGSVHMALNLTLTTLYAAQFLVRHARRHRCEAVSGPMIALSAASFSLLAVSGHLGGILAYSYGIRVTDEDDQRRAFGASATAAVASRASA